MNFLRFRISFILLIVCTFSLKMNFIMTQKLYNAHSNLESVEKLTIDYATKVNNLILNLLFLGGSQKLCNLPNELKITLCWDFLVNEVYKFKVSFPVVEIPANEMKCERQKFVLQNFDQNKPNPYEVPMFRCPPIVEAPFVRRAPQFYFSDSHVKLTGIVYEQENPYVRIYPRKYIDSIDFDGLKVNKKESFGPDPKLAPSPYNRIQEYEETQFKGHISAIRAFVAINKLTLSMDIQNPYSKFVEFYSAIDVCALTLTQKILLCRETILAKRTLVAPVGSEFHKYVDVEEFSDGRCHKFPVKRYDNEKRISALQCPPVVYFFKEAVTNPYEKYYLREIYFLAKNLKKNQATSLTADKKDLKVAYVVEDKFLRLLKNVKILERAMETIGNRAISLQPDYHDERSKAYNPAIPAVEMSRREAEMNSLGLAKFRDNNLVYEKFQAAYQIQNICHLRRHSKQFLCKLFLESQTLEYKVSEKVQPKRCSRHTISMVLSKVTFPRESEFTLFLIKCPLREEKNSVDLFLSGSLRRKSFLMHEMYFKSNVINTRVIIHAEPIT